MNKLILLLIGSFFLLYSNTVVKGQFKLKDMDSFSDANEIVEKLMNEHYGDLFNYVVREEVAEKAYKDAGFDQLIAIVKDELAPMKARFFACEILDIEDFSNLASVPKETLAKIYATALAENHTGYANSWGFLYEHDDEGTTGIIFLGLWDKAVPALVELLDNDTQHLYHGSKEATIGNAYRFRVKDFAAYYIGKITRIPVTYHNSLENRDKEIAALKVALKSYTPD